MHDLFEGVIPYELKLLIQYLVGKSYLQLDTLNHRLNSFDYGYSELGDKPAPIDEGKIRQSASQMWLLARIFPILVGDLIPSDDSHWNCFLKLLMICEICTAPVLSHDSAAYVEVLVEEHHTLFKTLYEETIIPKMHFMVHLAEQILNYGPLIHTWTMRHEAKLRVIKRAARVSNYKNVCQTVAKRHQHLLCWYMHSDSLIADSLQTGPCKPHSISIHPERIQSLLKERYRIVEESVTHTTSFATYNGITFKPDAFIILSCDNTLEPIFCKILRVIKIENERVVLLLKEYITEFYDSHYHAFYINEHHNTTTALHVLDVQNLHYNFIFHPRRSFKMDNKLAI
jgi:hypothetical protein